MLAVKKNLIKKQIEVGTGADVTVVDDDSGLRSCLRIWFSDKSETGGPVVKLGFHGLRAHIVTLKFGRFSGGVIEQIQGALAEDIQLARALIGTIRSDIKLEISDHIPAGFTIKNGAFTIKAIIRFEEDPRKDDAIIATCREVIVPIMAAMAELIGYEVVLERDEDLDTAFEGAISRSVILRRERNLRNRLLCIRIHGEKCFICSLDPRQVYGEAGSIIEVHHIEPVSLLIKPKIYDPRKDLIPLCPNCHRAVHTKQPMPFSAEEIKNLMEIGYG
jgi:5-methylcytosine-specific restriction protein A